MSFFIRLAAGLGKTVAVFCVFLFALSLWVFVGFLFGMN
ncbi:hypothetical protein Csa_023652 [Cucumis sativus]|nr:hypothetical protein Csa_023652 [Cucumis sativus]